MSLVIFGVNIPQDAVATTTYSVSASDSVSVVFSPICSEAVCPNGECSLAGGAVCPNGECSLAGGCGSLFGIQHGVYWNERDENDAVSRYNRTARLTHDPLEIRFGDQVQLNGPNDSCISSNKQTGASHRQTRAMGRDRLCLPSAM